MKRNGGFFLLTVWWFIALAIAGGLVVFFTPNRKRVSMDENRVLQNLPELSFSSLVSGEYASSFNAFLSDSVPLRKQLIGISDGMLDWLSFNDSEDQFFLDTTEKDIEDFFNDTVSDSDTAPEKNGVDTNSQDGETDDKADKNKGILRLIEKNGKNVVLVTYSSKAMTYSAANLDKCAELLPEDGRVFFTTMSFPGVVHRFSDNLDRFQGWESTLFDRMNELTCEKVVCVDSYKVLEPHILQGEDLFLHTNHQWNDLGAYYIFAEMIQMQGLTPTPYEEYVYDVNRAYYGSLGEFDTYNYLYPLAPSSNYIIAHKNHMTEIPLMNYHVISPLSYLCGQQLPWKMVVTGFHTGRNALIFGDCYSLFFAPYLLPYYDSVHYTRIKSDYFNRKQLGTSVADMIASYGITDIYYVSSESSGVNSPVLQYQVGQNLF